MLLLASLFVVSCSENEDLPENENSVPLTPLIPSVEPETIYHKFSDNGEFLISGLESEKISPRSICIKGDTLFVANNNEKGRCILIVNIKSRELIGRIDSWKRKDTEEKFDAEFGDIAVSDKLIFVGMYNSRINIFDRETLEFVNVIGRSDGKWGDDIYSMTHCYGLCVSGERLMVRDKNTIRGYWIYEALTEPSFKVPWIGQVKSNEIKIGYDYYPCIHGMDEHDGKMYITDRYERSVQVFTPSDMQIKFGEETHIGFDKEFRFTDIYPLGMIIYGSEMLVSAEKSGTIKRYNIDTGEMIDILADFPGREIGDFIISDGILYCIDTKAGKIMTAQGVE